MNELIQKFTNHLKANELKMTSSRELILNHTLKLEGHFDSESLYDHLKEKKVRVSRDAVFRNLPLLLESGIIQKSVGEGKGEYFEVVQPHSGHHDHMVCTKCGSVIEFFSKKLETLQDEICKTHHFKMTFHDHRIFGVCENCN